jgi:putative NADH-flavin reductase
MTYDVAVRLTVFGVTGGTGQSVVAQACAAGHEVTAFARSPEKIVPHTRLRIVKGDVFDLAQVTDAVRGRDAVLTCLGTRPWRHVDICSGGARVISAAMAATGVKRLVAMSSQGVGDSRLGTIVGPVASVVIRKSLRDKGMMEEQLSTTTLDWVCVRPGLLTNGAARGKWRAVDDGSLVGGKISRADVAAFMLAQLADDRWVRRRPVLVW